MGAIILQSTPLLDKLILITDTIKSKSKLRDFKHEWHVDHILTTWMVALEFNLVTGFTDIEICIFFIGNQYHVVRVVTDDKCDEGLGGLCVSKWPIDYIIKNSVVMTTDVELALDKLFDLLEAVELTDD